MELSIYDIHYIASKYLNLQRHVYVVSDWLVFFCSFLCCQCGQYLAQDLRFDGSETSSIMYQIAPQKFASTDRLQEVLKPRPLVIAEEPLNPHLGSTYKCMELFNNPRELEGSMESITPRQLEVDTTQSDELLFETTDLVLEQLEKPTGSVHQSTELWNLVETPVELEGRMEPMTSQAPEDLLDTLHLETEPAELTNTLLTSEPWTIVDPRDLDGMATVSVQPTSDISERPRHSQISDQNSRRFDQIFGNNIEPPTVRVSDSPRPNKKLSPVPSRSTDYPTVHSHRRLQQVTNEV